MTTNVPALQFTSTGVIVPEAVAIRHRYSDCAWYLAGEVAGTTKPGLERPHPCRARAACPPGPLLSPVISGKR